MVGLYCRISKQKEKGKDVSIEVQKKHGVEFAKSLGLEFRTFVDEGISGADDNISGRPSFVLLLDSIKKKEISAVYCIDQSRIERNTKIWSFFVSIMLNAGCKYYPNGKFLDLNIPENKLFTDILSATNEFYASITGAKVRDAINTNAKKGKTHGLTAYGYKKGDNGYFAIAEDEAVIIKRIYQLSLNGTGTYTIANILNGEKIPAKYSRFEGQIVRKDKYTNKKTIFNKKDVTWRGSGIYEIIQNPIYKGTRIWKGEPVPVPAIVTEELWQAANDNLTNNKKNAGKKDEYHYLLNGLVFCADCGYEFRGKKRLKGRDNAYKCKSRYRHTKCSSRAISIPKLETFIIQHLFISKDLQKYLAGLTENKAESDNIKLKLNSEKKELDYLKRVESKAYKNLQDPDFEDDETIKKSLKLAQQRIKEKEITIEILENKLIERNERNRITRVKNTICEYRIDAAFDDTKRLVHSLIKCITIKHTYKSVSKGGYFLVNIEYNGFDESSMFMTNWQALNWYWLSHYRNSAITEEDLEDDKALLEYYIESSGQDVKIPNDFNGFEVGSIISEKIELKKDELIYFD